MRRGYNSDSYAHWCLGPEHKPNQQKQSKHTPVTDQPGRQETAKMNGKVSSLAKQFETEGVIDTQPGPGRPLPHPESAHPTPVMSRQASSGSRHTASREVTPASGGGPAQRSGSGATPGSARSASSLQSGRQPGQTGGRVEMCETATSPDGSYHSSYRPKRREQRPKEIEVDYPIEKPAPKQKTKIVYDLGSPQMNTQGINASIPITTDKYTYTITSVLSSMSQQNNSADSPLTSPTSGSKRPITSYKIIHPNTNPKIGKIQDTLHFRSEHNMTTTSLSYPSLYKYSENTLSFRDARPGKRKHFGFH